MKIYLSYAAKDAALSFQLAKKLREQGDFDVWLDQEAIEPGDNWARMLGQALDHSDFMLFLLTPSAFESERVRNDLQFVLGSSHYANRVFTVFVGPASRMADEVPWILLKQPHKQIDTASEFGKIVRSIKAAVSASGGARPMREVFFSHANRDLKKAIRLRDVLVAHDVPVWFSPHHLGGAELWQDEIGTALARCDWFMILLTPNAAASMWVKRELNYALTQKRFDGRIIPLLFRPFEYSDLSWALPQFQMIDFRVNYWDACDSLLKVWDKRLDTGQFNSKPQRRKN